MKILIDGQTLLTPEINRGIGTYFKNVVEHILECDFTNDFYINLPPGARLEAFSPWARDKLSIVHNKAYDIRASHHLSKSPATELYSDTLNNDIERVGIQLYWSPNALMDNVLLPHRRVSACRFSVTIFDLIVLVMENEYSKHLPPAALALYKEKLKILERDYDLFLHISHHTQHDFTRMLHVEDKRHVVTALAADKSFRPFPFPRVTSEGDYVLYPGGFDPRKNMERAVEAFSRLQTLYEEDARVRDTELWIVCSSDVAAKDAMLNFAERLGIGRKVRLTGFVDDAQLLSLYQKARCLFFPSLYEGFGLPLLEGLACGLPAASSNISSLPEVGGEFAIYFDPYNVDEMADCLYQALREPMDYESRFRRYEYSKNFSWRKTALTTLEAFEDCEPGTES